MRKLGPVACEAVAQGLCRLCGPDPVDPQLLRRLHEPAYVDAFLTGQQPLASSQGWPWTPQIRDGVLAINAVLAAKDDHTLLWGPSSTFVGHPYTLAKIPYDMRDLQPVARISSTVVCLVVPTAMKIDSMKEFIAQVRAAAPGFLEWQQVARRLREKLRGFYSAGLHSCG